MYILYVCNVCTYCMSVLYMAVVQYLSAGLPKVVLNVEKSAQPSAWLLEATGSLVQSVVPSPLPTPRQVLVSGEL